MAGDSLYLLPPFVFLVKSTTKGGIVTTQELKTLLVHGRQMNGLLHLSRKKVLRYSDADYLQLALFLSLENLAAEDGSRIMRLSTTDVPSGDAFLQQLKKASVDDVQQEFNHVFLKQFKRLFPQRHRPHVIAIIDVHEQETYTKHRRTSIDVRGGKHKNGTNFFFHFVTLQIICDKKIMTLTVRLHRREESLRDIVVAMVRQALRYVHIDVLLLDRGFRDVTLINDMEFLSVPILMPAFSDERTRQALAQLWTSPSRRWSFRNAKSEYADVTLLKVTLPDGNTMGFYTTLRGIWLNDMQYYLDLYAKRWNIETGYRVQQQFLPKTTCVKGAVRLFYFSYAVAMHNLWLCIRIIIGKTAKFTVAYMKYQLKCALQIFVIDHG